MPDEMDWSAPMLISMSIFNKPTFSTLLDPSHLLVPLFFRYYAFLPFNVLVLDAFYRLPAVPNARAVSLIDLVQFRLDIFIKQLHMPYHKYIFPSQCIFYLAWLILSSGILCLLPWVNTGVSDLFAERTRIWNRLVCLFGWSCGVQDYFAEKIYFDLVYAFSAFESYCR